ncbi:MAG: mandelate racemase/muconate lactonizing enzyme family protein, partial [Desulfobacterales bacterium]|nr:mandelate racemase/muconate lactonizing enzyme family protein [Desulfobacterales bacterium]
RVKLPQVLTDSTHGAMSHFELVTVRVFDSDGAEGLGYTYAVNHGGASIHAMIDRDLSGLLVGADPGRIAHLWQKMWWAVHYPGRGGIASFAIAAIDIALWDLMGRKTGMPLWRLLGGHDPKVAAYAGGIDLLTPLPELIAQTDCHLSNGFRAIKMKIGRPNLAEDIDRVAAMRAHLGDGFPLMADANMRWSRDEAMKACQALGKYSLFWLEEPLIPEDEVGHAMLAQTGGIPIAAGENFRTIHEFARLIRAEGVMFPEPDVSNCGGITAWMKIAALTECNNLKVTSHGVHDLHLHLLAAVPNKSYLEVHGFGLERYIADPLVVEDGFATAPDGPGHGVAFDWEALAPMRV